MRKCSIEHPCFECQTRTIILGIRDEIEANLGGRDEVPVPTLERWAKELTKAAKLL